MHRNRTSRSIAFPLLIAAIVAGVLLIPLATSAQRQMGLDRVMTLSGPRKGARSLPQDQGSPGLWQKLLKLNTTASALYTCAHPDDEQGGVLAYLSRGQGVRMAMLQLNRGEAGANAIGPELFDGLGMIRTQELLLADAYYGLDDQYFTTMIDYGFSKSLEEALDQWGRENVLRDVVRVIRINRPLILISRFYGGAQDGHGNHQTAGVITQAAFEAAGDPNVFPEQIRDEGLRAWQPLKVYRSNLYPRGAFRGGPNPPEHRWQVRVDAGEYSPWLGDSYQNFSRVGLSYQRSQNGGRLRRGQGSNWEYFERVHSTLDLPEKESGFFDGIDTSLPGIFKVLGEEPRPDVLTLLHDAQDQVQEALSAFNIRNTAAVVPALTTGLNRIRQALNAVSDLPDAAFMLRIKERQFMDAINTALGIDIEAVGVPAGTSDDTSPFASTPTMGVVVPGQNFQVNVSLLNPSDIPIQVRNTNLEAVSSDWRFQRNGPGSASLVSNGHENWNFNVTVPLDAQLGNRYFYRDSIKESHYKVRDPRYLHRATRPPVLSVVADYEVDGERVELRDAVRTEESNLPYGNDWRELKVAPAIVVNIDPEMQIVPLKGKNRRVQVSVGLLNNNDKPIAGQLQLEIPDGWKVQPESSSFSFSQPGQRENFNFTVSMPGVQAQDYMIRAKATAGGKDYSTGYQIIKHRDYETTYIYRDATLTVRGIDVEIAPNLNVGYVMGVGDEVPSGIEQLGASVQLLNASDLASGNLSQFDAIVVGTRAYAVRDDLITYNQRLLDYAHAGGNLIILYQTQEFIPNKWAAYPAELPRGAEEVSEEDSPVTILAPDYPVFQKPNQITLADFDNWVEQRGSKFFSEWDDAYTPMIETYDRGQEPQKGGWLIAKYGDGYYTYFAYAIHRQVPYGVPGPYRIFANLLSLGK